ncbi:MAG TPA: ATP-dependent helicase HrpB [Geobacteraceae bacterium]|nr:ATP-dependent helicase HrpB [Geobacteraceae bacterium]
MQRLPIDEVLPRFLSTLGNAPSVVLSAPPGAGKTTRIPLALLDAPFLHDKKILMLEPRRLAAVNAARWMAATLGEEAGHTVGYTIRFERQVSRATRIEVVTEGILGRRLQNDPTLTGTGVVIFDEFHERNLNSDLALALCRDAQKGLRNDLKLVVMSATLDTGPIARLLDNAPIIATEGRSFPVEIRYLSGAISADIASATSRAVLSVMGETAGDMLVFLPGAGEIRRCRMLLEENPSLPRDLLISPLYGDLPFAAQEEAIMPADRRRVVLATNIAETSLTIEGVRVVVDSGYSRQLRFDPATGLNRLVTVRVSAASADQRAGRAGRLGPGTCFRLWDRHAQRTLLPFTSPEILIADLTPLALELAEWGVQDPAALDWLDPPPAAAFAEGRRLLRRLGALDRQGLITSHGRAMSALPAHPRLAHMLITARGRGQGALACDLAALLTERDIFRGAGNAAVTRSSSDLLDRVEALADWRKGGKSGTVEAGVDVSLCKGIERASRELRALLEVKDAGLEARTGDVGLLLALAYPDRIAAQREPGSDRYLLANGRGGRLSQRSAVRDAPFIVAVVMEGGERGDELIHQASAITLEELRWEFGGEFESHRTVQWDRREGRVLALEEERLGELVLAARPVVPAAEEARAAMLAGLRELGLAALDWTPQAGQFRARVAYAAHLFPHEGWPDLSDQALLDGMENWLYPYLDSTRSLAELGNIDIHRALRGMLDREQGRRLEEGFPTHLAVPSGSRIVVQYTAEGPPVLAVKLQELFGLADTPTVAWGRAPVLLHLLSPAGRPIQVTGDLRNFWNKVYPEVKKELKGRYPKHPWPDDPWSATPTRHTKKRAK